jgi:hypothetical protein
MNQKTLITRFINFEFDERKKYSPGNAEIIGARLVYKNTLIGFWHRENIFYIIDGWGYPREVNLFIRKARELIRANREVLAIEMESTDISLLDTPLELHAPGIWSVSLRDDIAKAIFAKKVRLAVLSAKFRTEQILKMGSDFSAMMKAIPFLKFGFEEDDFIARAVADRFRFDDETLQTFKVMSEVCPQMKRVTNLVAAARMIKSAAA